jgi:hypothetical protein
MMKGISSIKIHFRHTYVNTTMYPCTTIKIIIKIILKSLEKEKQKLAATFHSS